MNNPPVAIHSGNPTIQSQNRQPTPITARTQGNQSFLRNESNPTAARMDRKQARRSQEEGT